MISSFQPTEEEDRYDRLPRLALRMAIRISLLRRPCIKDRENGLPNLGGDLLSLKETL